MLGRDELTRIFQEIDVDGSGEIDEEDLPGLGLDLGQTLALRYRTLFSKM